MAWEMARNKQERDFLRSAQSLHLRENKGFLDQLKAKTASKN